MKLLIYTHVFPYPLNEGGKVAQFGLIEYFAKEHDVLLVTVNSYEGIYKDAEILNKLIPNLTIKILNKEKTYIDKGITAFIYNIVVKVQWRLNKRLSLKRPPSSKVANNNNFIYPARPQKSEIIDHVADIIKEERPDFVQVDFIDNADIVNILPSNLPKVLIHHDLRFVSVKQACEVEHTSSDYSHYLSEYVKTIEIAFLNKFNGIVTFSNDDKHKLLAALTKAEVRSIPFPVLDKNVAELSHNNYFIDKLIFIGPEQHHPNYDAIEWYTREMASIIWTQFKLKLIIIGKWSTIGINSFSGIPGVEFAGFIDNLKDITQNSLMLVPLRIGSGIRTKVLDAFCYGIPVISTSLGCEGLGVQNGEELIIADTPGQFVEAIQLLINNPELIKNVRNRANQLIHKSFSQKSIYESRLQFYNKLLNENSGL